MNDPHSTGAAPAGIPPLPGARAITAFHDSAFERPGWPQPADPGRHGDPLWQALEDNHRFNSLLWNEEDQARRRDVPDSAIAANKRAIDGFNQARNDAVERLDDVLLERLSRLHPAQAAGGTLHSETAGAMCDRLSILALKIRAMRAQTLRTEAGAAHVAQCQARLARLLEQRADLAGCLDRLLADVAAGRACFKLYRQFKMYNDPTLNPYLYGQNQPQR
jgi:hypothetical protein